MPSPVENQDAPSKLQTKNGLSHGSGVPFPPPLASPLQTNANAGAENSFHPCMSCTTLASVNSTYAYTMYAMDQHACQVKSTQAKSRN